MVKTLTERLITLSAAKLVTDAILPDTALGRFAKGVISAVMLVTMIEPVIAALN